ncbi:DUF397 domain-containing protein [Streptomyces galbus]|uniref:DUF397 domain-containing protein n=1 Tax=Streptomyces galbus TaxID=33898 RepID=A0A4U5X3T7_STRGB|nr:DUF397 domain-containing protein [Streptomyces galbus]NKQ27728.1 DUF397 domain-containing protein [Streptomyces galbus]TKT09694.1 DUF397 domain-containing protein [Streptomyces galbus]
MAESTIQQQRVVGWDKPELDLSNADWQSSSRGLGDVQIAFVEGFIAMRNSRRPESPSLIFTPAEWGAFVSGAREGEFDLT